MIEVALFSERITELHKKIEPLSNRRSKERDKESSINAWHDG